MNLLATDEDHQGNDDSSWKLFCYWPSVPLMAAPALLTLDVERTSANEREMMASMVFLCDPLLPLAPARSYHAPSDMDRCSRRVL